MISAFGLSSSLVRQPRVRAKYCEELYLDCFLLDQIRRLVYWKFCHRITVKPSEDTVPDLIIERKLSTTFQIGIV